MKSKHKFTPGQVVPMEDRALLSGFKFPWAMGPVTTLGLKGAYVLTSRTYGDVQNTVDKAIQAFQRDAIRALNVGDPSNRIGVGTLGMGPGGGYAAGSLLAKLDSIMVRAEARLPFGRGLSGFTGGVGLSTRTAFASANPASIALGNLSVAELMDNAISFPVTTAQQDMEGVRQDTLNIVGKNAPLATTVPGILPSYVSFFGPGVSSFFGLKNSC